MNDTYKKLLEEVEKLPKEAIERADKNITRKGYDTTGYQYQFLVNVLNEVLGIGGWGFNYTITKETQGSWQSGKTYWDITTDVEVWIKVDSERVSFHCAGGHKSEMHADALKGAITNGFKKTVAFFGVGKKAYEGTIDDDYRAPYQERQPYSKSAKPAIKTVAVEKDPRKQIMSLLLELDLVDPQNANKKDCEDAVKRSTDLKLIEENYPEIISRLGVLKMGL